ncbi:MAG: hypothetical protein JSW73_04570 [Candidatus Woesearchaeota archaeon]|nr:MAG: hypothetical protein JSW73_04570 [Candidatus Woesearchaeota archaeon]
MKNRAILIYLISTLALLMTFNGVSATTEEYNPTSGADTTEFYYTFNSSDISKFQDSDDNRYHIQGSWPNGGYNEGEYLLWEDFSIEVPECIDINNVTLKFEWKKVGCMNVREARLFIKTYSQGWTQVWEKTSSLPASDLIELIDLTPYISDADDLESLEVKFQAWSNGGGYTVHDWVELEIDYEECPTHTECNYDCQICEEVTGVGKDECVTYDDCIHDICNYDSLTCETVPVSQQGDSCSADTDCYHTECDYQLFQCVDVAYDGLDECSVWEDCLYCGDGIITPPEECEEDSDCECPTDGCVGPDWYDYPEHGDCLNCMCDTDTAPCDGPCKPTISHNDEKCTHYVCDYDQQECALVEGDGEDECETFLPDCGECIEDADCDNGLWCDGPEACIDNQCQPATAPCVYWVDECTEVTCDEVNDKCVETPIDDCCIDDNDCECEGEDGCIGPDWYEYPDYGICEEDNTCNIDDTPCDGPCKPTIYHNDERCYDCVDNDGDGYYAITPNCPEGDDCDDYNNQVYPGAKEWCCDGIDNDCDGDIDCEDDDCWPSCDDTDNDGVPDCEDDCIGENQANLPEDTTCRDWFFNSENGCHDYINDDGSTICDTSGESYYTCMEGDVYYVYATTTTYCGVDTGYCDGAMTAASGISLHEDCGENEICVEGDSYCHYFNDNHDHDFEPTPNGNGDKETTSKELGKGPSKAQSDFKIACGDGFCVIPQEIEDGVYYCPTDCGLMSWYQFN